MTEGSMDGALDRSGRARTRTDSPDRLGGKTCVVTGASRGIGREIARELGTRGASVVVNCRRATSEADEVADEIESGGARARVVRADVSDFDAVEEMAEAVHDEFGPIDVLVNNAGITIDRRFQELTPEDWQRVIDVNLGGAFNCTHAFYSDLESASDGRVINVSSVVACRGNVGQVNYAAAKSGLIGFTRSLALELAPSGTTVNCVAPGFTMTDMLESVREDIRERIRSTIPLDRFGTVEEIASIVRFLAGEDASYVTGEIVHANGGMYA